MFNHKTLTGLKRYYQRIQGSTIEYDLFSYYSRIEEVRQLEYEYKKKSDIDLKNQSRKLVEETRHHPISAHKTTQAFALAHEAIERVLGLSPFDVQLIGGMAIHDGKLAEMKTGEGKTLTAVFPAYLNALSGKGVHVLTFNDYLARRDARWMGPVYEYLGLSVGVVQEGMATEDRQKAYGADITYLTAKEAGFDYLRDTLCYLEKNRVHRPFHFAIVDEADSIMIDEARIPLVIAGASDEYVAHVNALPHIVRRLSQDVDYEFDEYARNIRLTDDGLVHVEKALDCDNLYDTNNTELLTQVNCALQAEYLLQINRDYIVRNGKVELVDEFTGRVADRRRWPDGLQAAIEAKEGLEIQSKGSVLNKITLQHYLQLYPRLGGMTATAQSAEREFRQFYHVPIVVIPPNRPCIREDFPDVLFQTKKAKEAALIDEIIRTHKTRRPILVGTSSVEESFRIAEDLRGKGVNCEVLNATRDEYEAGIVAMAGRPGVVTISTNMAGRGTDIRLGGTDEREKEKVIELGGLYVIGTNRHESRRIDDQLRGRAGRQGDPGSSRYFISLEDDLFVRYKLNELIPSRYYIDELDKSIDIPIIQREMDRIQRIIEGQNLDIKLTLSKYSFLLEQQRQILIGRRDELLTGDQVLTIYRQRLSQQYEHLLSAVGESDLIEACRYISLILLDKSWSLYLAEMEDIRESIHFRRIGGQTPLYEFNRLAVDLFESVQERAEHDMIAVFNRLRVGENGIDYRQASLNAPTATWTYLVNDNPFEDMLGIQLAGDIGLSVYAGILWPLTALLFWAKRRKE